MGLKQDSNVVASPTNLEKKQTFWKLIIRPLHLNIYALITNY